MLLHTAKEQRIEMM
jgi:hypothetical protein